MYVVSTCYTKCYCFSWRMRYSVYKRELWNCEQGQHHCIRKCTTTTREALILYLVRVLSGNCTLISKTKCQQSLPLSAVIGETVATPWIQKAGALTSLAKCAVCCVNCSNSWGREGIFSFLSKIPQNTVLHSYVVPRYLANNCILASRIDTFIEDPTSACGEQLRDQVDERLKSMILGRATLLLQLVRVFDKLLSRA